MCALAAPALAQTGDIVLYSSDIATIRGNWARVAASGAAGGQQMASTDRGWSTPDYPQTNPSDYFETTFSASAGTSYRVWLRLQASSNSKWNDAVWVQFSDSLNGAGSAIYRIGTSSGLLVNLEPCKDCGVNGWGWQDNGYWTSQTSTVRFAASGSHTIRVQTREDGVQIDQIVLSPSNYLSSAPGQGSGDATIVPKSGSTTTASTTTSTPFSGTPVAIPGTIQAESFDNGSAGVAYYDSTTANQGGAYRSTAVDLEAAAGGGYNVGWTTAGEWLKYGVNVTSAGTYTISFKVASAAGGGSFHLEMNGTNVTGTVPVPSTGGWQSWTNVSRTVLLNQGVQTARLIIDSAGANYNSITFTGGSAPEPAPPPPPSGSGGGRVRIMTWNIHQGRNTSNVYNLNTQASYIASQHPDVVLLQEVNTWDGNQPQTLKTLLQNATGQTWTLVWAPVTNAAGTEGNVVLTRLPVSSSSTYQMHATSDYSAFLSNRSVARATVSVGGVSFNVFATHLDYANTSWRTTQLSQLMSWLRNFAGPRVVGGDFNSWWGEYWITTMMTEYYDTLYDVTRSKDGGYTVNNAVRFDYIFRSHLNASRLTPVAITTPRISYSDHNPVIADFTVQ
jgi:endonuclease/exonuclease/phosphatase family metal-dependent hydrolase